MCTRHGLVVAEDGASKLEGWFGEQFLEIPVVETDGILADAIRGVEIGPVFRIKNAGDEGENEVWNERRPLPRGMNWMQDSSWMWML